MLNYISEWILINLLKLFDNLHSLKIQSSLLYALKNISRPRFKSFRSMYM